MSISQILQQAAIGMMEDVMRRNKSSSSSKPLTLSERYEKYGIAGQGGHPALGVRSDILSPKPEPKKTTTPSRTTRSSGSSGRTSTPAPSWPEVDTSGREFFENMPEPTYYQPLDPEERERLAREYASLQVDPHIQALQRSLEQAIADAAAQEERIRAAYAGTEETLGRREEEQARRDLESAIARGAGRSGVVDWLAKQRDEHYAELLAAEEAKKAAELADIARQLATLQRQVPEQISELEARRGALTSQELQRLRDQAYQRGREYDMDQWQRMLNIFDRTTLTPQEQLSLYLQMAETAGQFPERTPNIYGR